MDSTAAKPKKHPLLGEVLLKSGRITQAQLNSALAMKERDGLLLGQALVELGLITEDELSDGLSEQGKMLCIKLTPDIIDAEEARRLDEKTSRRLSAVIVNRIAGIATVAMDDPTDLCSVDEIAAGLKSRVLPVHSEKARILECVDAVWRRSSDLGYQGDQAVDLPATAPDPVSRAEPVHLEAETEIRSPDKRKPTGLEHDVLLDVLRDAVEMNASDVHFEPGEDGLGVRFRVDGTLIDRPELAGTDAGPCLARLKALAGLDQTQSRLPQDASTRAEISGHTLDLRIATTPTLLGEGAVVRFLSSGRELLGLESLGLDEQQSEALRRMVEGDDGLVLATGPTGSGRKTTLYSLLQELNHADRKVITLEDPVEVQVAGMTQIHADSRVGLTFSQGLRSILHQDPDVIFVGEIPDEETAHIAVQAALTGHQVLSTLHTTSTVEAITRLQAMGIESYLLADTLRGVLAQRLVRRICSACRRPVEPEQRHLGRLCLNEHEIRLFEGAGCTECRNTGYRGRVAILELLVMTPELCRMVQQEKHGDEIRLAAMNAGMMTLRQDAIRKMMAGMTTFSEALGATARVDET